MKNELNDLFEIPKQPIDASISPSERRNSRKGTRRVVDNTSFGHYKFSPRESMDR
eukprot:CAMPEP_0170502852 /NCGR_PEP_ID=MMETSP0208-20121228/42745_1 /TAXON_ID=197538 /ORGANISM="Strombidium inclinatum, Strain S3" /LENGTH=54 /DNA_ID=CAMNT_0010782161 /DNA_START=913 /DNA_END=1077 /DNA_ORIENTATION=-